MIRALTTGLLLTLLAACGAGGGLFSGQGKGHGINPRGEAVNGLVVGHRLMAAGEHEMALKAYLRSAAEDGVTADTLSAIGSANLELGRLGQAEQILRRALEMDPEAVPALNNLGVILMERGKTGEAKRVFEQAYGLDSGQSDAIRENLKLAIARTEAAPYDEPAVEDSGFKLVRREKGQFVLLTQL